MPPDSKPSLIDVRGLIARRYIEGYFPGVFKPDQLQKLYQVFDAARQLLTAKPTQNISNPSFQVLREKLTSQIITAVVSELDPAKLSEIGLSLMTRKV